MMSRRGTRRLAIAVAAFLLAGLGENDIELGLLLSRRRRSGRLGRDRKQFSTQFAFTRFLVPHLMGYEGRAVFMDCDMLVLDDIARVVGAADDVGRNVQPERAHTAARRAAAGAVLLGRRRDASRLPG